MRRLWILSVLLLIPSPLMAAPIQYQFDGTLDSLTFNGQVKDPITGEWSAIASHPELLDYWFPGLVPGSGMSLTGSLFFDADNFSQTFPNMLQVDIGGHVFASRGMTSFLGAEGVTLVDFAPTILTSLPTAGTALNPDDLVVTILTGLAGGHVVFDGDFFTPTSSAHMVWSGNLTDIHAVPEPTTLLLVVLAGGLIRCRRSDPAASHPIHDVPS